LIAYNVIKWITCTCGWILDIKSTCKHVWYKPYSKCFVDICDVELNYYYLLTLTSKTYKDYLYCYDEMKNHNTDFKFQCIVQWILIWCYILISVSFIHFVIIINHHHDCLNQNFPSLFLLTYLSFNIVIFLIRFMFLMYHTHIHISLNFN